MSDTAPPTQRIILKEKDPEFKEPATFIMESKHV